MAESERQRSGDEDPRHRLQCQRGRGGEAGRKDVLDNFLPNNDQFRCLSPPTPRTTYLRLSERKSRRKLWQRSTPLLCKTSTSPTRWPRKNLNNGYLFLFRSSWGWKSRRRSSRLWMISPYDLTRLLTISAFTKQCIVFSWLRRFPVTQRRSTISDSPPATK